MRRFVVRRALAIPPVLLLLTMVSFGLLALAPGNPALNSLGITQVGMDQKRLRILERQDGLGTSIVSQYLRFLKDILHGSLGTSLRTHQSVLGAIGKTLPVTFELGILAVVLAIILGFALGVVSAIRVSSPVDAVGTVFAFAGAALPQFWLAILLVFVFGLKLRWFPVAGFVAPDQSVTGNLVHLILPAVSIAALPAAVIVRQVRGSLLEAFGQDYLVLARAKGIAERRVILVHALKNALIPAVTVTGLQLGGLLSGAVFAEDIFSINGMGNLLVQSINFRDYTMVVGIVFVLGLIVVIVNFATDILYGYLDPRIRLS